MSVNNVPGLLLTIFPAVPRRIKLGASALTKQTRKRVSIVAGVAGAIAGLGFFLRLAEDLLTGRGADLYVSTSGYHFTSIGVAVLLAIGVLVCIAGMVWAWLEGREERDFLRKYGRAKKDEP